MPNPVRFPATHKFYWPGQAVSFICLGHLPKLKSVAAAIGLHVEIEPLPEEEMQLCRQNSSCPFPPEEDCPMEEPAQEIILPQKIQEVEEFWKKAGEAWTAGKAEEAEELWKKAREAGKRIDENDKDGVTKKG